MIDHVEIRIICYDWDDPKKIKEKILEFLKGLDLKKERINIEERKGKGLISSEIVSYRIKLDKKRHINVFLKNFFEKLGKEEREKILRSIDKIIDEDGKIYLRFDKDYFILKDELKFVDHGEVLHITLTPRIFRKSREKAIEFFKKFFRK